MLLNYCGKEENKVSLEQMREEVLAMLKVCFEGEAAEEGERIRLILPDGKAFSVYGSETGTFFVRTENFVGTYRSKDKTRY